MKAWFRKLFGLGAAKHKATPSLQQEQDEPLEQFTVGENITQEELNQRNALSIQRYHFYQSMLKDAELAILALEDQRNTAIQNRSFSPDEYGRILLHIREIEELAARFSQDHLTMLQRSHDGRRILAGWRRSERTVDAPQQGTIDLPAPYTGSTELVRTGEAPREIQQPNGELQATRGMFRITAQQDDGSFVLEHMEHEQQ